MLEQFLNHLEQIAPVRRSDKFLLAVSGGIDSMVMLDLFRRSSLIICVAHCNFQLRSEESLNEEYFVSEFCSANNIPFVVTRFDTKVFAEENKLSTQVAARQLRYEFFENTRMDLGFDWIVTAHHLNDSFETFLLNAIRGAGIDGLTGIPLINGNVIRPLLKFNKEEIMRYAGEFNLQWMDDSSNFTTDYARNLIRHKVIPVLKEINPSLEHTFSSTSDRLKATRQLYDSLLQEILATRIVKKGDQILLEKSFVLDSAAPAIVLWEWVREFGFSYEVCRKIVRTIQVGKWFSSNSHRLLVDRSDYIVEKRTAEQKRSCQIELEDSSVEWNGQRLDIEIIHNGSLDIVKSENIAQLDMDSISFPLTWRYWRDGDFFYPLGMNHQKKISDFLVDQKVDRLTKERVSVLESGGEIIWIVGYRISDKVKVRDSTKRIIVIKNVNSEQSGA